MEADGRTTRGYVGDVDNRTTVGWLGTGFGIEIIFQAARRIFIKDTKRRIFKNC